MEGGLEKRQRNRIVQVHAGLVMRQPMLTLPVSCVLFRSMSMSDMRSEEEAEHVQPLGLSRYERMQEQYNHNLEEEDHWRDVRQRHIRESRGCTSIDPGPDS